MGVCVCGAWGGGCVCVWACTRTHAVGKGAPCGLGMWAMFPRLQTFFSLTEPILEPPWGTRASRYVGHFLCLPPLWAPNLLHFHSRASVSLSFSFFFLFLLPLSLTSSFLFQKKKWGDLESEDFDPSSDFITYQLCELWQVA